MILRQHDLPELAGNDIRNGHGPAFARLFTGAQSGSALRGLVLNRLPVGSAWGLKKQVKQEEFFFIVSGRAEVQLNDERSELGPLDLVLARDRDRVAIRNPGPDELVFLAGALEFKRSFLEDFGSR